MRIKSEITIYFIFFTILISLFFSIATYFYAKANIKQLVLSHLEQVAVIKENKIIEMLKEVQFTARDLSNNQRIKRLLISINSGDNEKKDVLQGILNEYKENFFQIREIAIIDSSGMVVASTTNAFDTVSTQSDIFEKGIKLKTRFYKFFLNKENGLSVILSEQIIVTGQIQGLIVVELKADNFPGVSKDNTGLGRSGETLIATKEESGIYLTRLKYGGRNSFIGSAVEGDSLSAMDMALKGKEGTWENLLDYSGKEVIAVTSYIKEPGLGVVTKMDKSEAFENLVTFQKNIILINLALIPIAIIVALLIGGKLSKPITTMTKVVNEIESGDLSKRVSVQSNNEIGELAKSFNSMAGKLEKQIDSLDRFAYVVSHDLKAPLQSIRSLVDIIKETDSNKISEESKIAFGMLETKSETMEMLINGILDTAKNPNKNLQKINLQDCITEAISLLDPPKNFSFKIGRLPEVYYDKTSLFQIFQNLINNAIKYNDKDNPFVLIESEELTDFYKIFVKDNGIGIREDKLAEVFDLFTTAHKRFTNDSHGIGLNTVKKIVTENGGNINITSKPGEGTTIYFTIKKQ